ncbi:MAG: hypothetical protein J2P25_15710 [Nocardiopsaceae bacterium]|nr:hypothetical protein [Nocardiopsaceae bacterium]
MALEAEVVAEARLDRIRSVIETDGTRSAFTVEAGDGLLVLDPDLTVQDEWRTSLPRRGTHAADPARGIALISDSDQVRLIDRRGRLLWSHEHVPWKPGRGFEAGCAWFDHGGDAYAVVPEPSFEGCHIVRLDIGSGQVKARSLIEAVPAGITPVHHRDGWVGLSEGEGQDGLRAWWVRSRPEPSPEFDLLDGGWDDEILVDVDPTGTRILNATPDGGPLQVRSFPGLDVLRIIEPPEGDEDRGWDWSACFADDFIISKLTNYDRDTEDLLAVAPDGTIHSLGITYRLDTDYDGEDLTPAGDGTWLMTSKTGIRRYCLTRR